MCIQVRIYLFLHFFCLIFISGYLIVNAITHYTREGIVFKRNFCILTICLGLLAACKPIQEALVEEEWNDAPRDVTINIDQSAANLPVSDNVINLAQLQYMGAFRLPGGWDPPQTFAYGGNAMTFNPDGDPANNDAHSGSLFIMGHDRIAYGGVPDGNQVAGPGPGAEPIGAHGDEVFEDEGGIRFTHRVGAFLAQAVKIGDQVPAVGCQGFPAQPFLHQQVVQVLVGEKIKCVHGKTSGIKD